VTRSPTGRRPMSDETLAARDIYERFQIDPSFTLSRARVAYREAFGVSHEHKSIDEQYLELVAGHFGYARLFTWCAPDVAIPLRIALAFFLREMSGRKSKDSSALWFGKRTQMKEALELKAKYMKEEHLSADDAELKAANEIYRTYIWRGQRRSLLTVNQMIEGFSHPARYGIRSVRRRSR
jgi:hypothetical protein